MLIPKEKPPITVVGDVGGRIAIIVVCKLLSLLIVLFTMLFFNIFVNCVGLVLCPGTSHLSCCLALNVDVGPKIENCYH